MKNFPTFFFFWLIKEYFFQWLCSLAKMIKWWGKFSLLYFSFKFWMNNCMTKKKLELF